MKKKILFVDSWSIGKKFVYDLANELNSKNNCFFLDFDNLQIKSGKVVKKFLTEFDYEFYNTPFKDTFTLSDFDNSVLKALDNINPDLLIFISIHGLEHKYINEIAEFKKIPCIMFMHGIQGDIKLKEGNLINKIVHKFPRFIYFNKCFFLYLKDLRKIKSIDYWLQLKRYFKLIFKHKAFLYNPKKDIGLNYKVIFIINDSDISYFENNYGFDRNKTKFITIGHIETHNLLKFSSNNDIKILDQVVFFSQPLTSEKFISKGDFEKALQLSMKISAQCKLKFLFRCHPRDDFDFIDELKNKYHFDISKNSLEEDLFQSKLIIGINSTALYSAQVLKKKLLLFEFESYPIMESIKHYKNQLIINFNNEIEIKPIVQFCIEKDFKEDFSDIIDPVKYIVNFIEKM